MSEQNYKIIWDEALKQIENDYKINGQEDEFKIWFNMTYVEDSISEIIVSVPSDFMWTRMVNMGYVKAVETKIEELCGQVITIKYTLKNKPSSPTAAPVSENENSLLSFSRDVERKPNFSRNLESSYTEEDIYDENINKDKIISTSSRGNSNKHSLLNEKYTFENFIKGDNSEFAYSASLAAAKEPGKKFNPLLIYGGVGLGKTHLMQAIGNYIYTNAEEKENLKICYITAENFTNEFTKSIRDRSTDKFKSKYRSLNVLLLDDIHFLMNKEGIQEELFHTFEALYLKKAQMIFTCDRPLSELKGISERLKSRFTLGSPIDLQPPNYETRKAILLKKLEDRKIEFPSTPDVPEEVIDIIAKNVQSNVRELESCLIKLTGYAELTGKTLTTEIAEKELKDFFVQTSFNGSISIDVIQKVVANHYNLSISDIKSKKRNQKFVVPRNIAIYIARELGEYSYPDLGEEFGGRDHTTILHSYVNITDQLKIDPSLKSTIELLTKEIKEFKKN